MRSLVLLSGGYDSAAVLHKALMAGDEVVAMFVSYGQVYDEPEARAIGYLRKRFDVHEEGGQLRWTFPQVDLKVSGDYIGYRNLALMAVAANHAGFFGCDRIVTGSRGVLGTRWVDGAYKDSAWPFYRRFQRLLRKITEHGQRSPKVSMPLVGWTKSQVLAYLADSGIDLDSLWSCYGEGPEKCGDCRACESFQAAIDQVF